MTNIIMNVMQVLRGQGAMMPKIWLSEPWCIWPRIWSMYFNYRKCKIEDNDIFKSLFLLCYGTTGVLL